MDLAVKIDDYRAWFSKQRNADAKRMAFAALGTFEKLNGKTDVSRKQLIPIVNATLCRFKAVWMMGADLLFRVGANNKEARDAVLEIMTSKKAAERFHVICMLGYLWDSIRLPRSFMEGVIRTALNDKSALVRVEAAVAADRLVTF